MDNQIKADAEQVRADDLLKSSGHDTDSSLDQVNVMMIHLLYTHLQLANLMKEKFYDQVYTLHLLNKAFLRDFLIQKKFFCNMSSVSHSMT